MEDIDVVVTLCREENCPYLPGEQLKVAWPLPDPASAPDDELDEAFRATRDELLRRLPMLLREM
jgi:arsenate reductase